MRDSAARSSSVVAGIVTVLAGLIASPAAAVAPSVKSHIVVPDTILAAGQTGSVSPIILTSADTVVSNLKFVIDARGVASFATVDLNTSGQCTQAPAKVWTCHDDDYADTGNLFYTPVFLEITAAADASAGTTGEITFKFTADGLTGDTRSAKVTIGEGVDLGALPGKSVTAAVGESFVVKHGVVNAGEVAARGAVAVFGLDYPIVATTHYSNCAYDGDVLIFCTFTDDLAPGHSYEFSMPYKVRSDAVAPDQPLLENGWFTVDDFAVLRKFVAELGLPTGTPGDGPKLSLTDTTPTGPHSLNPPQTDINAENNFADTDVRITGTQRADVAAVGDTGSGTVGSTVKVKIGIDNHGPAAAYTHDLQDLPMVDFVVPVGATVTAVDADCLPWNDGFFGDFGEAGQRHYRCLPFEPVLVEQPHTFAFTLRIDAAGTTTAPVKILGWGDSEQVAPPLNANTANDTAAVVLTGTAADGDHGTGGLPVTGTPVAIVAGIGAILLGAGFVLFRMARRRRLTEV